MSRASSSVNSLGAKVYTYSMPPLPSNLILPPLPPIPVKKFRDIALTHTSVYGVTKETFDLDTAKYTLINDYEKLEFLGDKILSELILLIFYPSGVMETRLMMIGLCVDMMVHEVFPGMRQGVSSVRASINLLTRD